MMGLFLLVIVGAALVFLAPPLLPTEWRSVVLANGLRVLGVMIILFGVLSTSYVHVPDGALGELFRVYGGGSLPLGRIVAVNGENGPQARIFTPGFHFEPLVNVLYQVRTAPEVAVPDGQVATLVAKDGAALRAGQVLADPFPANFGYTMLDAQVFLRAGGQRGPQLSVLPPGRYRINHYLWDVKLVHASDIPAGFVGVVKSNVWAAVDFGTLRAAKPAQCTVPVPPPDSSLSNVQRLAAPTVPVGCTGVWDRSLPPGKYYFNPAAFAVTDIDTRAQVWTYAGGYTRATIALTADSKGEIRQARHQTMVPVAPENAGEAIQVKMEGWDIPLELRVIAQVAPDDAPCVVAGVGTLKQVEDRVLSPSIRAITRDVAGGTYEVTEVKLDDNGKPVLDHEGKPSIVTINRPTKALDLINQRPLIEGEIERRIRPEGAKSCVTIREVRLGEPVIPPELLVAVRREQLATQLAKAFIQERGAQEMRVASENAKSTADQQAVLVRAVIGVQTSEKDAEALKNLGLGQRDQLKAIAEGQRAQMDVLGAAATVRLRQYELLIDKLFSFASAHPEVVTAALTNAQKFVPNIQVGQAADGGLGGLLAAALGRSLSHQAAGVPGH